ncbi:hypothetical protein DPMN_038517 [Dreissena polymorpha]|uniref:Uncharacterized protein n=1 Tax=Dreissena polymorpha TaxID=45954 RepID=A0A9D4MFM0_DREPO|nr:hypothetical protein DPMN_038517 [Dreissena polymorpha]
MYYSRCSANSGTIISCGVLQQVDDLRIVNYPYPIFFNHPVFSSLNVLQFFLRSGLGTLVYLDSQIWLAENG